MLAGPFLEGVAVSVDGLEQPLGAALAFPERPERGAEVVLRHGPVERHVLAGPFLEGVAVSVDGLEQPLGAALAFPERREGGDALHTRLAALCVDRFKDVWHARLGVIEAASGGSFEPFYQVVVIWPMIIFALFGLVAPFNPLSIITIVLSAISLSSVVFVILDLNGPYGGFFSNCCGRYFQPRRQQAALVSFRPVLPFWPAERSINCKRRQVRSRTLQQGRHGHDLQTRMALAPERAIKGASHETIDRSSLPC